MSCGHCGQSYRDRHVAASLAFFGGVVGMHRAYMRSWTTAGLYLAASLAALLVEPKGLALIAACSLVEGLIFLSMKEPMWRRSHRRAKPAA